MSPILHAQCLSELNYVFYSSWNDILANNEKAGLCGCSLGFFFLYGVQIFVSP